MNLRYFERVLRQENYAENTIVAYEHAVQENYERYSQLIKKNLQQHKVYLIETYRPQTVNVRINALNKYLDVVGKPKMKLTSIKLPHTSFLENVISNEEYLSFKRKLQKEEDLRWYFTVWILAATGARISELVQPKVDHIRVGYLDICSKGGRTRRLYIPDKLRNEALKWIGDREGGYLFLNYAREPISPRGIAVQLKKFAKKYGLDPAVVHPTPFVISMPKFLKTGERPRPAR